MGIIELGNGIAAGRVGKDGWEVVIVEVKWMVGTCGQRGKGGVGGEANFGLEDEGGENSCI